MLNALNQVDFSLQNFTCLDETFLKLINLLRRLESPDLWPSIFVVLDHLLKDIHELRSFLAQLVGSLEVFLLNLLEHLLVVAFTDGPSEALSEEHTLRIDSLVDLLKKVSFALAGLIVKDQTQSRVHGHSFSDQIFMLISVAL